MTTPEKRGMVSSISSKFEKWMTSQKQPDAWFVHREPNSPSHKTSLPGTSPSSQSKPSLPGTSPSSQSKPDHSKPKPAAKAAAKAPVTWKPTKPTEQAATLYDSTALTSDASTGILSEVRQQKLKKQAPTAYSDYASQIPVGSAAATAYSYGGYTDGRDETPADGFTAYQAGLTGSESAPVRVSSDEANNYQTRDISAEDGNYQTRDTPADDGYQVKGSPEVTSRFVTATQYQSDIPLTSRFVTATQYQSDIPLSSKTQQTNKSAALPAYHEAAAEPDDDASSDSSWDDQPPEPTKQVSSARDWNKEFQRSRSNSFASYFQGQVNPALWEEFTTLLSTFRDTAVTYTRIIVSELNVPFEHKTIKPADVGGVAGGSKYIFNNILFKVAVDNCIGGHPNQPKTATYMYGGKGNGPSDYTAMKASNNEMVGCEISATSGIFDLRCPVMIEFRYKGYCVLAMPVLPIGKKTIVHGSSDGGLTIHNDDPVVEGLMESHAQRLNLQPHKTGLRSIGTAYVCGDIEVHKGTDNHYYMLDFGRVFPPEDPKLRAECTGQADFDPRSVFYALLRPELVKNFKKPLCSDAFTRWNGDPDINVRTALNENVSEATRELYQNVLPAIALRFDDLKLCGSRFCTHQNVEVESKDHEHSDLDHTLHLFEKHFAHVRAEALHRFGANLRHTGSIRKLCTNPDARRLLLTVCVARCLKTEVEARMRVRMRQLGAPADSPFYQDVVDVLNMACWGTGSIDYCAQGDILPITDAQLSGLELKDAEKVKFDNLERRAARYWKCEATLDRDLISGQQGKYGDVIGICMKAALVAKFGECLTDRERDGDLREHFSVPAAAYLMLQLLDIKLTRKASKQLLLPGRFSSAFFVPTDIEEIAVRTKLQHFEYFARGNHLMLTSALVPNKKTELRLLERSSTLLAHAHSRGPLCPLIMSQCGMLECRLAPHRRDPLPHVELAADFFEKALRFSGGWQFTKDAYARHFAEIGIVLGLREGTSTYGEVTSSKVVLTDSTRRTIDLMIKRALALSRLEVSGNQSFEQAMQSV